MTEFYTDSTVDLVARTLWAEAAPESTDPPTPTCVEDARKVLGALTAAGLLIPPGGELEYAVHIANTPREGRAGWDNGFATVEVYEDFDEARGMAEHLATDPNRPTRVVQRPVNPFPWEPVTEEKPDAV